MASDDDGWVGRTLLNRYAVSRRVGSGGMSTVYEATDTQLGRPVAIKLFNAGEARDDLRRRSEVDMLARLNDPHLVTMYDAHLASGDETVPSFLVMELVAGPDLRSTLDHGPLLGAIAAQITTDIARGLAAMHAQGIVHRDLKPANILLAPTGLPSPTHRAKLADFGIAQLVGADRMTTVGTIIGTASYLSPEQASGADPGPASDVYALGLVILEGLTGRREYPGTIVEAMSARASRDPVIDQSLPGSWISLLTQMTARDASARPSAIDVAVRSSDIAHDLAAWNGPESTGGIGTGADTGATAPLEAPTRAYALETPTAATVAVPAGAPVAAAAPFGAAPVGTAPFGVTAADTAEPKRPARGRRAVVVVALAALLVGGVWAGVAAVTAPATPSPAQPAVTPDTSDVPAATATDAPPADPAAGDPTEATPTTPATEPSNTSPTASPATTAPSTPVDPAPAPSAPAPTAVTGDTGSSTGNNGNGNGNNGNGNGNGNNGNGKSKG